MLILVAALLAIAPGDRVVLKGSGEVRVERVERVDGERVWLKGQGDVAATNVATLDEAIAVLSKAIEQEPKSARLYLDRGLLRRAQGDGKEALSDVSRALKLNAAAKPPDAKLEYRGFRTLAAISAASPDPDVRSGFLAVQYGLSAVSVKGGTTGEGYDTLAAAYAESGKFEEAILHERSALKFQPDGVGYADRLKLYKDHKPCRDETGTW